MDPSSTTAHAQPDLASLLRLSTDWYWKLDAQYRLLSTSVGAAGVAPAEHVQLGQPPWSWAATTAPGDSLDRLRATLQTRMPFRDFDITLRDHHGRLRYLVLAGEPLADHSGDFAGYHGTARDVTAHRRAESLVILEHAVTRSLAEASTSRRILQAVMRAICEFESWETGGYFRVEGTDGATRLVAGWSGPCMSATAAEYYKQTTDTRIPAGGMISRVVATREPLWLASMDESQTTWAQRVRHTGERATFFCPVLVDGRVIGVFAFSSREIREPDDQLLQTMRVIGEQVGQFLERKQAEQVLRESEARFRALTQLSSDWYWELDAEFRFVRIEGHDFDGCEAPAGVSAIGRRRWECGLDIEADGGWDAHRANLEAKAQFRDLILLRRHDDGSRRYFKISGEPIVAADGRLIGYRGVGRDITQAKLSDDRIQHLATHDALTGLPNRVLFSELLQNAIRSEQRRACGLAVLFIDLDRFKAINDSLGHDAGDTLLCETGRRLVSCVRSSDTVARLGGDEFVVMLRHARQAEDIDGVAHKILTALARPVTLKGGDYRITASIGVSRYGVDAKDERAFMQNADAAMYAAKHKGKNACMFFTAEMAVDSSSGFALELELRNALERDQLALHYQPKIDLETGSIVGAEALLRWHHPVLGTVPPDRFIKIAEETGMIVAIGLWVLRRACRQVVEWQRQGLPAIAVAVNVSARQFADENLVGDVATILRDSGMSPSLLELEITESMVIQNIDRALRMLGAFKSMGVRLAIDDFGTGYSSLSQLRNLPIDTLKVDRSFIRELPAGAQDRAITEAIIAMGKTLSMTVIAEGVETEAQERYLHEHACDQVQGYLFGKPAPADEFVLTWRRMTARKNDPRAVHELAGEPGDGAAAPHPTVPALA